MDRSEIFDKIAEVAADVLGVDVADIATRPLLTISMPIRSSVCSW